MCGICGVVYSHPERPVNREMLRQMTDIMHHRGPDSHGFYVAPGIGLGIRRLSIIDLETGDQPISNEDGTVTVVCNGEIYNFQELRQQLIAAGHRFRTRSDVEVIVHLYEDYGIQCVNYLRGMFGFALGDANNCRLMLPGISLTQLERYSLPNGVLRRDILWYAFHFCRRRGQYFIYFPSLYTGAAV